MNKIGIYTLPLTTNYGGILQNYALQKIITSFGYEVYTIDTGKFSYYKWFYQLCYVIKQRLLGHKVVFPRSPQKIKQHNEILRGFIYNHIKTISPSFWGGLRKSVINNHISAIVVGSDQVWRPGYNDDISESYLSFCEGLKVKKIAYAASFGTDIWEYTRLQTLVCSQLVKNFSNVSVREKSAIPMVKEKFDIVADFVLDPTLLLCKEEYCGLCDRIPKNNIGVLAYLLDGSYEKISYVKRIASQESLPFTIISAGKEINEDDSIERWLSFFRDASIVVTDSFHGTVFSIIFNKKFHTFENTFRGNSRMESLLSILGLEQRLISSTEKINEDRIDWENVECLLKNKKEYSINWLKNSLGSLKK